MSELRKELGIDDWLELVKEDKNLDSAYTSFAQYMYLLEKENQQLKEDIKDLERIVGIRQKRNLILKFDKEYDEEDKKKNPNRDYASITPDAEVVYVRYYKLKDQLKQRDETINEIYDYIQAIIDDPVKYATKNNLEVIFNIVKRYKGDNK